MSTQDVPITLQGEAFEGFWIRPEAGEVFVRKTFAALRDATRFQILRTARKAGRPFEFLSRVWDAKQAPWQQNEKGETVFVFRVPTLETAAPVLFEQKTLFEDDVLNPNWTAFDLLGQVVASVQDQSPKDSTIGYGMLQSLHDYRQALRSGLKSASFPFKSKEKEIAVIDDRLTIKASQAMSATPSPKLVRLVGRLDMLRMSDHLFQLIAEGNTRIRGLWTPDRLTLKPFLGEDVLVEAVAAYRPNGSIAFLEAKAIRRATDSDAPFRRLPIMVSQLRLQDSTTMPLNSFAGIKGKWPGDDSDETINALLQEIS